MPIEEKARKRNYATDLGADAATRYMSSDGGYEPAMSHELPLKIIEDKCDRDKAPPVHVT